MQQQASESEQYAYCSLAEIQAQTEQKQHLIQVLYVFENYYVDTDKLSDFTYKIVSGRDQNHYNLTLCAYESGEKIVCEILYNPNMYANEDIAQILARLEHVLHALAANPEMKLSELETTTEEEKEQILGAFQTKPTQYPHEESIKSLFEAQVKKTPDRIAVSCGTEQLTYAELNAKANIVANRLRAAKVRSETGQ
ncbi:condensation domain-containing protein, partial [Paenibacillus chitinolyticus]|uniref:condensation domain-containing protein n=1 Tax=Paenibacillus chitinolyticus TaxID=79263 RepID=UPI001C48E467